VPDQCVGGPTVMLFFEFPEQPSARPANTLIGHLTGLVVGLVCLYVFGLQRTAPAPVGGLTLPYAAAGALSVALTTLMLTWLGRPHPPAGATTLIVSLGVLTTVPQLLSMAGAVLLISAASWGLNVLLGTKPAATKSRSRPGTQAPLLRLVPTLLETASSVLLPRPYARGDVHKLSRLPGWEGRAAPGARSPTPPAGLPP
jgi:hypothetical protein